MCDGLNDFLTLLVIMMVIPVNTFMLLAVCACLEILSSFLYCKNSPKIMPQLFSMHLWIQPLKMRVICQKWLIIQNITSWY